jgi:hypothetical protein
MCLFALLTINSLGLLGFPAAPSTLQAQSQPARGTVYLGAGLTPEQVTVLSATIAAGDPTGILLLDGPTATAANDAFLAALNPPAIVPVGSFPEDAAKVGDRLGECARRPLAWTGGAPRELWHRLFPRAEAVVVCPAEPRRLLLQAACLAGALKAPLFVTHGRTSETRELNRLLKRWQTRRVYTAGSAYPRAKWLPDVAVTKLAGEAELVSAYLEQLGRQGPVSTLVVANPSDSKGKGPELSSLAPWVALRRRAALLLTGPDGADVEKLVLAALRRKPLRRADTLLLVADLTAIPPRQRPNPIKTDKDEQIEMEPLTPTGLEPFSFSVGRLFHKDPGIVPLLLARKHLLARKKDPPRALVVSNPGGSLPLLETFSRSTVHELRNCGCETTALFGKDVDGPTLRRQLRQHDIFLWEGHHNTLIIDWKFPEWDEPLPPALVFLQSCLALKEEKVRGVLGNGAVGVIGSSTRTYSASGGACSLCFFNGVLYEGLTFGEALRQSKNFLLAYAMLKEKRLGKEAQRGGANLRAAWAFTLWGDPTLRLPASRRTTAPERPPVRHTVTGNTIRLKLPSAKHDKVVSSNFRAQTHPNSRLAGLVRKEKESDARPLVPLVFAEVHLPKAPKGRAPRLRSRLPSKNWVFNWDARRRCGYLLAVPRARDTEELRFSVHWEAPETASTASGGQ